MLSKRYGAVAVGACACLVVAAGAACSKDYAAEPAPVIEQEAGVDAALDAPVADVAVEAAPPDAAPTFEELATGLTGLGGIVADDTNAYVSTATGVMRVPLAGGLTTPLSTNPAGPIAFANGAIFWSELGDVLFRKDAAGTAVAQFALPAVPSVIAVGQRIALSDKSAAGLSGMVRQYTVDTFIALPSAQTTSPTSDIATRGPASYWTESTSGSVWALVDGFAADEMVKNEPGCDAIAVEEATVYWTRPGDGLVRAFISADAGPRTLASGETAPSSLVADDGALYWLNGDGKLRRKRIAQELPAATLASGFQSAWANKRIHALAVTAKYAVWITNDGRVLRTDK